MFWSGRGSWCALITGAAGIDEQSIADIEEHGVAKLLDELVADLKDGRWRRFLRVGCSFRNPGREERRPLSIPTIRYRVVQAAVKIVMRADLRGRHAGVLVRVQAQALGARRAPGRR